MDLLPGLEEDWTSELHSSHAYGLSVENGSVGGLGLFYKGDATELLRIPKESTLSIYRCMEMMNSGTSEEAEYCREFIKRCLSFYCTNASESRILVCYCVAMLGLSRAGKLIGLEQVKFLAGYLDILLHTQVDNVAFDNLSMLEYYKEEFGGNSLVNSVYMELTSGETREFAEFVSDELDVVVKEEEVRQLNSAVRSRILEIPRSSGQGDDFVTDITLVPLLDFANHDNAQQNAHFDVDRTNSDVILKAEGAIDGEVFISYSPVEDINRFFFNYGFIPRSSEGWKLIEIPFWGYSKNLPDNASEIVYRLAQTTNMQLCVSFVEEQIKDVKLNLLDNYSFLALAEVDWAQYLPDKDDDDDDDGQVDAEIVQQIMEQLSEVEIDRAISRTVKAVREYLETFGAKLSKFDQMAAEFESDTHNIRHLIVFETELSRQFCSIYDKCVSETDPETAYEMVMPFDECLERWNDLRLPAIYKFTRACEEVPLEELEL